jgi:hypothetical protein
MPDWPARVLPRISPESRNDGGSATPFASSLQQQRHVVWRSRGMIVTLLAMPRWLWALIIILIILVFIVPNPVETGEFLGNAFDALIAFFKAIADSVNSL